jgi:ribose-phosphate pyrophosphokinase
MTTSPRLPIVFALGSSRDYGERVAGGLGVGLSDYEERQFADGERKLRPLVEVCGQEVFVVAARHDEPGHSPRDKLCDLLFFIGTLKDAGADSVAAIVPYLCYARADRRTAPGDPLALRYVAQLFETVETDRVLAIDVHEPAAFENAFRLPTRHLEAGLAFAQYFVTRFGPHREKFAVVAPDPGSLKRAQRFRGQLGELAHTEVPVTAMGKLRLDHVIGLDETAAGVRGRIAIIVDDMIATGSTLAHAIDACRKGGARQVFAAVTHGLFLEGAEAVVTRPDLDGIVIADTVPPFRLESDEARRKLTVIDTTALVAEEILRSHYRGPEISIAAQ